MKTMAQSNIGTQKYLAEQAFLPFLHSFEIDAVNICREFHVAMAVNVFGVGTPLPNELALRRAQRPGF